MRPLGECTQVPVTVTRIEWVNRPYRTEIPPAPLHDRWHLEVDEVRVTINTGIRVATTSTSLATRPRQTVELLAEVGDTVPSGTVVDLVELRDVGWTAQVALLVVSDTVNDRTRWRVRPSLTVGAPHDFLMTGLRSGHGPVTGSPPERENGGARSGMDRAPPSGAG